MLDPRTVEAYNAQIELFYRVLGGAGGAVLCADEAARAEHLLLAARLMADMRQHLLDLPAKLAHEVLSKLSGK